MKNKEKKTRKEKRRRSSTNKIVERGIAARTAREALSTMESQMDRLLDSLVKFAEIPKRKPITLITADRKMSGGSVLSITAKFIIN